MITFSCTDDKDGDWDDNIKLSQKEFLLDSSANSVNITTKGESWWISEIFFKSGKIIDISDIDTTSKNFEIIESDFILKRKNANEITIDVFKNDTNLERTLIIGFQSGNYFDGISIIQSNE